MKLSLSFLEIADERTKRLLTMLVGWHGLLALLLFGGLYLLWDPTSYCGGMAARSLAA